MSDRSQQYLLLVFPFSYFRLYISSNFQYQAQTLQSQSYDVINSTVTVMKINGAFLTIFSKPMSMCVLLLPKILMEHHVTNLYYNK